MLKIIASINQENHFHKIKLSIILIVVFDFLRTKVQQSDFNRSIHVASNELHELLKSGQILSNRCFPHDKRPGEE